MKRNQAILLLQQKRQKLSDRFLVASLFLFGSVARDNAGSESNIDIFRYKHFLKRFTYDKAKN